jgi:uncharacterized hydantoinase/oxoprolinase family protein
MIDIGSTTTDIIPLDKGRVAVRGRTDTERLRTGELVYAGIRRTPLCALATELPLGQGPPIGLAAELFATSLDVFLTLGDLDPATIAEVPRPSEPGIRPDGAEPAVGWQPRNRYPE